MANVCTVCIHPERDEIDKLLILDGSSIRDLAGQYKLSKSAVDRHRAHASEALKRAIEVKEYRRGEKLLDKVEDLTAASWGLMRKAKDDEDWKTALTGVRETRGCLELVGRVSGELKDKQENNTTNNYMAFLAFLDSPEWVEMKRQRGIPVETTAKEMP